MGLTIGIDVGGTKVAAGVVDEQGQIIARTGRWTPSLSPDKTEDVIADVVRELTAMHVVDAVGLGAAGSIDLSRLNRAVRTEPRLAGRAVGSDVENASGCQWWWRTTATAPPGPSTATAPARGVEQRGWSRLGTGIGGGFVFHGRLYGAASASPASSGM